MWEGRLEMDSSCTEHLQIVYKFTINTTYHAYILNPDKWLGLQFLKYSLISDEEFLVTLSESVAHESLSGFLFGAFALAKYFVTAGVYFVWYGAIFKFVNNL